MDIHRTPVADIEQISFRVQCDAVGIGQQSLLPLEQTNRRIISLGRLRVGDYRGIILDRQEHLLILIIHGDAEGRVGCIDESIG